MSCLASCVSAAFGQTWTSVWSDEFTTVGAPSPSRWAYETGGGGWGNSELQTYTSRTENSRVDSTGALLIEARRDFFGGAEYTSARLKSNATWTYGRFEYRAKLPAGRGTWPALWMLPASQTYGTQYWPDNGEIDTMEHVGYDPGKVHCSIHSNSFNWMNGNTPTNFTTIADVFGTFNTYVTEWRPHEVRSLVNGQPVLVWARQGGGWGRWPFNQPFSLRMNVAVGGSWGGAQGVDATAFPARMTLDYVRVSKLSTAPYRTTPLPIPGLIQAEDFDNGGNGFAFYDLDASNNGGSTYRTTNVDIANGAGVRSTPHIGWIEQDEWWTYTVRATRPVKGRLQFLVASPNSGRSLEVQLNDRIVATNVTVPNTGSWSKFVWTSTPVLDIPVGTHQIRIVSNSTLWNFDAMKITLVPGRKDGLSSENP